MDPGEFYICRNNYEKIRVGFSLNKFVSNEVRILDVEAVRLDRGRRVNAIISIKSGIEQ